jgi:transposase InsO family protein
LRGSCARPAAGEVFEKWAAASAAVFEFIEIWDNRRRRHSTLDYLTPAEYEEQLRKAG